MEPNVSFVNVSTIKSFYRTLLSIYFINPGLIQLRELARRVAIPAKKAERVIDEVRYALAGFNALARKHGLPRRRTAEIQTTLDIIAQRF